MELSYVFAAVKRYAWVVQLGALGGLVLALLFAGSRTVSFEAGSTLLVRPERSSISATAVSGGPRYVEGQAALLASSRIGDRVVEALNLGPTDTFDVDVSIRDGTDLVDVVAVASTAELAGAVANAFPVEYINERSEQISLAADAEIAVINRRLGQIEIEFADLEAELSALPFEPETPVDTLRLAQIASRQARLESESAELFSTKNELELIEGSRVQDEIIEFAFGASEIASSSGIVTAAGAVAGAVLGIALAVLLAASSRRVLDNVQLEDELGAGVVGTLQSSRRLRSTPIRALTELPTRARVFVDQLCVRAESVAKSEQRVLVIAVVGAMRSAGTTTISLAMAGRFGARGTEAVVIDADEADPFITDQFGLAHENGVAQLVGQEDPPRSLPVRAKGSSSMDDYVNQTSEAPGVSVLGLGAEAGSGVLQRDNAGRLISCARMATTDIVLIDCGPLLQSAATVQLAQLADVVVFAVPVRRADLESLSVARRLLDDGRGVVLAVATETTKRRRRKS